MLAAAFAGVEKLLLISANEVGRRLPHHLAVIAAAKQAGVHLLVYTSLLRADTAKMSLAAEHLATGFGLPAPIAHEVVDTLGPDRVWI